MSNFIRLYIHLHQKVNQSEPPMSMLRFVSAHRLSNFDKYSSKISYHCFRFTSSLTKCNHCTSIAVQSSNNTNIIRSYNFSSQIRYKNNYVSQSMNESIHTIPSSSNTIVIRNKSTITTNTNSDNNKNTSSNNYRYISRKKSMNQIPYQRYEPILKYIERIGLGIRPNQGKKYNRNKNKQIKTKKDPNMYHHHHRHGLSPQEEASFFAHQRRMRKAKTKTTSNTDDSKMVKVWGKYKPPSDNTNSTPSNYVNESKDLSMTTSNNNNNTIHGNRLIGNSCWWIPPPPFSPSSGT